MSKGIFNCTYIPVEIIKAAGLAPQRNLGDEPILAKAEAYLYRNLCAFSRQGFDRVVKELERNEKSLAFYALSCDSGKRSAEVLKFLFKNRVKVLDVPRNSSENAVQRFAERLRNLGEELNISQRDLEEAIRWAKSIRRKIRDFLKNYEKENVPRWSQLQEILNRIWEMEPEELSSELKQIEFFKPNAKILVTGSLIDKKNLFEFLENMNTAGINNSCGGIRQFLVDVETGTDPYWALAEAHLKRIPCARNGKFEERFNLICELISRYRIHGIIYHSIKFCEFYATEGAIVSRKLEGFPVLFVETDYSSFSIGQVRTRIEAFVESILRKRRPHILVKKPDYFVGIDSGSTSTNMVILDKEANIVGFKTVPTGASSLKASERVFEELTDELKINRDSIGYIVATGYGRVVIPFASEVITEISCHAKGAHRIFPEVRTIIDIGGQDSKVIKVNERGEVVKFAMNDKCAAGTGRFLEVMSKVLQVPLEKMGEVSLKANEVVPITSICTVFAESEVISLIAEGKPVEGILAGVHSSVASRVVSMLERIGKEPEFAMTGGVARNIGVVRAIENRLGRKLKIHETPEIIGALGAALFAYEAILGSPIEERSA